jgi:hypothetical protein
MAASQPKAKDDAGGGTTMKATIQVNDKKEAELIRTGLEDAGTRAFVQVMGALMGLPSNRARVRVLKFVSDHFNDDANGPGTT